MYLTLTQEHLTLITYRIVSQDLAQTHQSQVKKMSRHINTSREGFSSITKTFQGQKILIHWQNKLLVVIKNRGIVAYRNYPSQLVESFHLIQSTDGSVNR